VSDAIRFLPFARRAGLGAPELHFAVNGREASVPVSTFGPGDIVGIDARELLRADPPAGSIDFSPNYLAALELRRADLPWCVSPGTPDAHGRLMPWIALIVIDADRPPPSRRAGAPLPVLDLPKSELPPWDQLWAWAHVQLVGDAAVAPETLLEHEPGRALARVLAPRALQPKRQYRACLVPTFEAGRLAGLGQPVAIDPRATTPAWSPGPDEIALPVYAEWTFTTGEAGDFEALARRLEARNLAEYVVPLPVDGAAASAGTIPLPSVLRPIGDPPSWDGPERAAARAQLERWLARPAADARPVLGPPLYGGTEQAATQPDAGFLADLNLDPRYRAAAGLGAEIVRREQERLVARAWEALGDAGRASRERGGALLAELLGQRLVARLASATPSRQLLMASPALARIRRGGAPSAAAVRSSALPAAVLTPAFRRAVATKGGAGSGGAAMDSAVRALARRTPTTGSTPLAPANMLTWNRLHAKLHPGADPPRGRPPVGGRPPVRPPAGVRPAATRGAVIIRDFSTRYFAHRNAVLDVVRPRALAVEAVAAAAVAALAPRALARLATRLDLGDVAVLSSSIAPLVAAHEDPSPLAPHLVAIDRRFMLPGAEVPPDTVGVLAVDAPFVEAILIGANHELLRELAWRGVPSDRRGTPLTQFFDVRGATAAPDIPAIHSFARDSALGVVLLIKGELLRRFPDALVFAARAVIENQVRKPGSQQRLPTFRGKIGDDTTYFGVDLDVATLLGGGSDPGWFVVIQERRSAPRFGFDVAPVGTATPATWSDFAWSHVPLSGSFVSVAGPPPAPLDAGGKRWGENGAHMASIALQRPVRVALHASLMVRGEVA
jgi:hypothetical protein